MVPWPVCEMLWSWTSINSQKGCKRVKPHGFFPMQQGHWTLGSCFKLTQMVWNNSDFQPTGYPIPSHGKSSFSPWNNDTFGYIRYTPRVYLMNKCKGTHVTSQITQLRGFWTPGKRHPIPSFPLVHHHFHHVLIEWPISVGWFLTPLGGIVCGGGSALGDWHAGRPSAEKKGGMGEVCDSLDAKNLLNNFLLWFPVVLLLSLRSALKLCMSARKGVSQQSRSWKSKLGCSDSWSSVMAATQCLVVFRQLERHLGGEARQFGHLHQTTSPTRPLLVYFWSV